MKENYEKTGHSAFVLAMLGFVTLGLTVPPAMACALVSKRQAQAAGRSTDGYATSALVISLFLMGLIFLALVVGGMALLRSDVGINLISEEVLQALMLATGTLGIICMILMLARTRNQHEEERTRLRRLAGRAGGSSTGKRGEHWHRRRVATGRHWD